MALRLLPPLLLLATLLCTCAPSPASSVYTTPRPTTTLTLPYAQYGWTDAEAARYLADRFTFGATDALVAEIQTSGPGNWLQAQLYPEREAALERELATKYPALTLDGDKMVRKYPAPVLRLIYTLVRAGIQKVDYSEAVGEDASVLNEKLDLLVTDALNIRREDRPLFDGVPQLQEILDDQDYGDFMDLLYQQMALKTERAIRSDNQLVEVLTDFWFNHFNVSLTRINETANFIPSYERDAIRPYVLGDFGEMLKATAQHPAMLTYLDNARNNPDEGAPTLAPQKDQREQLGEEAYELLKDFIDRPGLNENYARELLELHTLGVDGGYSQRDVEEVARVFTGWKVPLSTQPLPGLIRTVVNLGARGADGAVLTDMFHFNPEWHDSGRKTVLGKTYPAGMGYEEGVAVLEQLAAHPATARHITAKLAQRFAGDTPPAGLVSAMAGRFTQSGGDIRQTLLAMVQHRDFWRKELRGSKVKQPFHYIVSAARVDNLTNLNNLVELLRWNTKLGQPLYACQPPTGYPYTQAFWTTGSGLLGRMDFAAELIQGHSIRTVYDGPDQRKTVLLLAGPEFQTY